MTSSSFCAERSVASRRWNMPAEASDIIVPEGIDRRAAQIAAGRGVTDLETYFDPNFRNSMPDPAVMKDMDAAVHCVADCILAGGRVGIVGDYDVDGATSVAILVRYLRSLGRGDVVWRIPMRIKEGYGLNDDIVREMKEAGVSIMMVVDNGTAAVGPVALARSLGLDVVILDHHEAGDTLPDAILVNPKRPDEPRDLDYLCTAGLAFLFVVALRRALGEREVTSPIDIRSLLGLVALGTVADVVPLVGLNRAYVKMGLSRMHEIVGIRALADVTRKPDYTTHACGFVFGPCLNAAGRLDDMKLGAELLMTEDASRARHLAGHLNDLNAERQKIQREATDVAKERYAKTDLPAVIVAYDESWHPGVVGLIASKLKDAFDRPAIVIGSGGKGSCRSVDGFHVGAAVIEAQKIGLLLKGGGHAAAAGLTIDPDRLTEFQSFMNGKMKGFSHPPVRVDAVLQCGSVVSDLMDAYLTLAPFGQGNTTPQIVVTEGYVDRIETFKGRHLKLFLDNEGKITEAMGFDLVGSPLGDALVASKGKRVDVFGSITKSTYAGRVSVYVSIKDAMVAQ